MNTETTQTGASTEEQSEDSKNQNMPRHSEVEDMADKLDKIRNEEREDVLDTDPSQRIKHDGISKARNDHGDDIVEPAAAPIESDNNNSVTDYIVEQNGEQMFAAVVDGKQVYIPLERARSQLQKHEAAEVRLQIASERSKSLDERERQILANEANLNERGRTEDPSSLDTGDREDLKIEARDVVSSLFSETEEEAADKLVNFIEHRTSGRDSTPLSNDQLVDRAADVALEKINQREVVQDAQSGYGKFQADYPDIMADQNLFLVADNMTEDIASNHPDWPQSKVMSEAGRITREWAGGSSVAAVASGADDLADRRQRKEDLVVMPNTAGSAQSGDIHPEKGTGRQTPKDALAEIRESRGQSN